MIIRPPIALAMAVAIAMIVCGCGGSSSDSSISSSASSGGEAAGAEAGEQAVTTGSLSKTQFVKQANAICTRQLKGLVSEVGAYEKQHSGSPAQAGVELRAVATGAVLFPKLRKDVEEIRVLGAPSGDEAQVGAYLAAVEQALAKAGKQPPGSLLQIAQDFKQADKLGTGYGLKACVLG